MKEFFVRLWNNCTRPASYAEIIKQPFANSLGYISFLILLYVLIFSIIANFSALSFTSYMMDWIDRNFPALSIENGEVSANVMQPYLREIDGFALIIDTTGRTEKIGSEYKQGILIAKKQVFIKRREYQTEVYDIPQVEEEFVLDASMINSWINIGKYFILPLIFIFVYIFYWIVIILKIFFYSLVSLFFNAVFSAKLSYTSILNIGAHALTLPFLLSIVIENLGIPVAGLIYNHLLYLLILGIVIYQNRPKITKA